MVHEPINTIGNELKGCENCNNATDHQRNELGLWSCVECDKVRD